MTSKVSFDYKINNITEWKDEITQKFIVQEVPWVIEFNKEIIDGVDWLRVILWCENEDNSPNWSYAATALVKLIPFNQNVKTKELQIIPYIFDSRNKNFVGGLIKWNDLLSAENSFVRNDSINLKIKIKVADPNDENGSGLKYDVPEQCCPNTGYASIRLNVTNIDSLLAVRSPEIILRNVAWRLTVNKNQSGFLGIRLESTNCPENVKYKTNMTVELISPSKKIVDSIKKEVTRLIDQCGVAEVQRLVSWEELLKRKNGFVTNNTITLDVKISVDNRVGNIPNAIKRRRDEPSSPQAAKPLKLECPICLQTIRNQEVSSLSCSHLFCTACITEAIKKRPSCPICKAAASSDDLRSTRLPFAN